MVRKEDQQIRMVTISRDGRLRISSVVKGTYWGSGYDERAGDDIESYGLPAGTYRVSFYPSRADSGSDAIVHLKAEKKVGNKFVRVDLKTHKIPVIISKMEAPYEAEFKKREGLAPDALCVTKGGNISLGYIEPKTAKGPWRARDFPARAVWTPYKFKTKKEAADYLLQLSPWRG